MVRCVRQPHKHPKATRLAKGWILHGWIQGLRREVAERWNSPTGGSRRRQQPNPHRSGCLPFGAVTWLDDMNGSDYNFGPPWIWKALFALAAVGAVALVAAIVAGIIWLIAHVRFV